MRYYKKWLGLIIILGLVALESCSESREERINGRFQWLERTKDPRTCMGFVREIVREGEFAIPPTVKRLRESRNSRLRVYCIVILEELKARQCVDLIRDKIYNDEDEEVRATAVKALANLEGATIIPELIELLKTEEASRIVEAIQESLGKMGEAVIDELINLLKDPNVRVRVKARETLVSKIGKPALPKLITALSEKNDSFILELFIVLAGIGDKSALGPMKEVMKRYPAFDDANERIKNEFYKKLEHYYNKIYGL